MVLRIAADLRLDLESRGEAIGMADYLIAAICLSRSAILITRNRAQFGRIPGLNLAMQEFPSEDARS